MDDESDISVIIDKNWEYYWKMRFKNPLDDAESLILDKSNFIQDIGQPVKEIKEIDGKKSISIETKNKNKIIFNDIDVVSLNYGFYPNNDIGRLLGLDGTFNIKKNYYEIKKNIFNQTSDKNIFFVGESARNVGAKISLYEGQLTGFFLNKNSLNIFKLLKMSILFSNLIRSILFQKFLWIIFKRSHSNIVMKLFFVVVKMSITARYQNIKIYLMSMLD